MDEKTETGIEEKVLGLCGWWGGSTELEESGDCRLCGARSYAHCSAKHRAMPSGMVAKQQKLEEHSRPFLNRIFL